MKRPSNNNDTGNSTLWWAVGGAVTLVAAGAAVALLSGGVSDEERGYRFLPGCGGPLILDQAKADAYAQSKGRAAAAFPDNATPAQAQAWATQTILDLGIGTMDSTCSDFKQVPQPAMVATFDLIRRYIKGMFDGGRTSKAKAESLVKTMRLVMITQGADGGQLVEGLPS